MKVIVFGTGSAAQNMMRHFDKRNFEIIFFSDNNVTKYHTLFHGVSIIPPSEILDHDFDWVILASQYSSEIMDQLLDLGIPFRKILPLDPIRYAHDLERKYQTAISMILNNTRKKKIALIHYNNSVYSGTALFRYMPDYIKQKYEVSLIEKKDQNVLREFDVICSSSHDGIYEKGYINIELWHGFPLKKMGFMHKKFVEKLSDSEYELSYKELEAHTHMIASYSDLYSTFYNASYHTNASKFRTTGIPRNDYLLENGARNKLETLLGRSLSHKNILFYLPTWRKGGEWSDTLGSKRTLFELEEESADTIASLLNKLDIFLIVKLHPVEHDVFDNKEIMQLENVHFLSEKELSNSGFHLYELLNCADALITDYSSVYFDTLLIDLPVIFAPADLQEYEEHRGFFVDPHQYLTPGPTVTSFRELEEEITKIINDQDEYKEDRNKLRQIAFKHADNRASERVWAEIDTYLESLQES